MADFVAVISGTVRKGMEEEFLALLEPVLDAMRHEETFVNAILHRDPEAPNRFMLYETWTDADDVMQVQMHRDYRQPFQDRLPELLEAPREMKVWHPMRGDFRPRTAG